MDEDRRDRRGAHSKLRRACARAAFGAARGGAGVRRQPHTDRGPLSPRARSGRNRRLCPPREGISSRNQALVARARGRRSLRTMNTENAALLDEFCDAVWLEDGLAKNTLESYRRDLSLFADWHERQGRVSLLG